MVDSYLDFANKTRSEKAVLCHIEPVQRLLIWTLDTGSQYKRAVDNFIIGITDGETALTEGTLPLNSGEWFYNSETGEVYVRTSDDSIPNKTAAPYTAIRLDALNSPNILNQTSKPSTSNSSPSKLFVIILARNSAADLIA